MKEGIGGYFELELSCKGREYHSDAIALNSARNCFEYILRSRKYKKVYIPYYTCEVMLEPLIKCRVEYEFYHIDKKLDPCFEYNLKEGEAFLYTNYYGLKQETVERLAVLYGNRLIVDDAQAFFAERCDGIDTFYSARKFFGVPDGAYLYTDKKLQDVFEQDRSYNRMYHLLKRADIGSQFGFNDYHSNEEQLVNQNIRTMSAITHKILSSVDYERVIGIRRENYRMLDMYLERDNKLHLSIDDRCVPMVYPYLTSDKEIRSRLIENSIFVAKYWPNVDNWCSSEMIEKNFAENMIPLPIDQRYGMREMKIILELINNKYG